MIIFFMLSGFLFFTFVPAIIINLFRLSKKNKQLKALAQKFNLNFTKGNLFRSPIAQGHYDEFSLKIIHHLKYKNSNNTTEYILDFLQTPPFCYTIKAKVILNKIFKNKEILVGSKKFDDVFVIKSDSETDLIPRFNLSARKALSHLLIESRRDTFLVNEYTLKFHSEKSVGFELVDQMITFGKEFTRRGKTEELLYTNSLEDSAPGVQARNLNLLLTHYPDFPHKEKVLKLALENSSPVINLLAYRHSPNMADPEYYLQIWNKGSDNVKKGLISFLEKNTNNLEKLKQLYSLSEGKPKERIISTFAQWKEKSVSNMLVQELSNSETSILSATVKALGHCGNLEAVEPLLKVKNLLLRKDVKESIQMIQKQHPDTGGWLTLSEDENHGALSYAESSGNLSLETKEEN